MNNKPLTYDSLKTVLLYMDPNTRLLLCSRAPSIQITDRSVPLRINKLRFDGHYITVNDKIYEYAVCQVDCKDNKPYKISGVNILSGRRICDVDEFGIRDFVTKAGGRLPESDGLRKHNLFGGFNKESTASNERCLQRLKEILEIEKQRYNQLLNYRPKSDTDIESNETNRLWEMVRNQEVPQLFDEKELKVLKNIGMVRKAIEESIERIRAMENELLPFENRRNNIRPKFEIHLIRFEKGQPCLLERINYTGNLHKDAESLMKFMFSKRCVQVNSLTSPRNCPIQFPCDIKFRIESLIFDGHDFQQNLQWVTPIMDNLPLEKLSFDVGLEDAPNLDYEIIETAKFLRINGLKSAIRFARNLEYQVLECGILTSDLQDTRDFKALVKHWKDTNKPIGMCYKFVHFSVSEWLSIRTLEQLNSQYNESFFVNERCLSIPMNSLKVLKVSHFRYDNGYSFIKLVVVPLD